MKDEGDFFLSVSDLLFLFRKHRRKILFCTIAFASLALCYTLTRPISYLATATFRERNKTDSGISDSLSQLKLLSFGDAESHSEAVSWFLSRTLMEELIAKNNLQAELLTKESYLGRARHHLISDYAIFRKSKVPSLKGVSKPLVAKEVKFPGEEPLLLTIFPNKEGYQLFANRQKIGEGCFGEPFSCETFSLTLEKTAPFKKEKLILWPLSTLAELLRGSVKAKPDPKDSTLVKLQFAAKDRKVASEQLNSLMALYQNHLKEQQRRVLEEQLDYLERRQEEMSTTLNTLLEKHVVSISNDLSTSGFANSENAMEFLAGTLQKYKKNLFGIELEMQRLKKMKEGGIAYPDSYRSEDDPVTINALLAEMRALKQQGDAIELALSSHEKPVVSREFQGINLKTAQELYVTYCRELGECETKGAQYAYVLEQMENPAFEVSSLSTVLIDPVSRGMIERASDLTLRLKDENHRSQKEQERLKEELALQRGFLDNHLRQTHLLSKLHEKQLLEKVQALQQVTLELIKEQMAILEKHLQEYIVNHLGHLDQEKMLILEHQNVLSQEMARVPSQWISEKMIDRHLNMSERLMGEVTKLVETKNITSNMEVIQAGPVDLAIAPLHAKPSHFILFTLFGAFFGFFTSGSFLVGRAVFQGLEATPSNLILTGHSSSGEISKELQEPLSDADLETCRHVVSFFKDKKKLLLVSGDGPDYSPHLANLFSKRGEKTLLLPLSFNGDSSPGLLHYLKKEIDEVPIVEGSDFDTLPPGGVSRYLAEWVHSERFFSLLENLNYDRIIVTTPALPLSGEVKSLLDLFDSTVVNLQFEKIHELESFKQKNVTFVTRRDP